MSWILRRLGLLSTTAAFIVLSTTVTAQGAPVPRQGVYESCAPGTAQTALKACVDRLDEMHRMGFDVVVNYEALRSNSTNLVAYADAAAARGMKLIWSFHQPNWWDAKPTTAQDMYVYMAKSCSCATDDAMADYVVKLVRNHPATWGYYVGDETPVAQAPAATDFSERIHNLDAGHPRLFIGIGDGVERLVTPFAKAAEVIGADIYPVGMNRPLSDVQKISERTAKLARAEGRRSAMVLQAFNWAEYPASATMAPKAHWPTRDEMRAMRDYAVAGGEHDLILWWSYYHNARATGRDDKLENLRSAAFGNATSPLSATAPASITGTTALRVTPASTPVQTVKPRPATKPAATAAPAPVAKATVTSTAPSSVTTLSSPLATIRLQAAVAKASGTVRLGTVRCRTTCSVEVSGKAAGRKAFAPVSLKSGARSTRVLRVRLSSQARQAVSAAGAPGRISVSLRITSGGRSVVRRAAVSVRP